MSNVVLPRESRYAGRRNKTVNREIIIGPNAIKFIGIAVCAILAFVYLSQSTAGANRGVKQGQLEARKSQISEEMQRLAEEQNRLQALKEIEGGIDPNALQPPTFEPKRP